MKSILFKTNHSVAPFIIRIILGGVVLPHGAQKLFGWFGGYGFSGTMTFFTDTVGLPYTIGLLVILIETIGALALIAGFATRLLAIPYLLLAFGIALTSSWENGFFMNWFGNQAGEGYEYFILWGGMAASLIFTGGGKFSVDSVLFTPEKSQQNPLRKNKNTLQYHI